MNETILSQEAFVPPQKSGDSPEPESTRHDFESVGSITRRMVNNLVKRSDMLWDDRMDKDQGT